MQRHRAPTVSAQARGRIVLALTALTASFLSGCIAVTSSGVPGTSTQPAYGAPRLSAGASASSLVGTWRVDLRPSPEAPPYYQSLVIDRVEAGRIAGSFYGAPIAEARINLDWGAPRIAFVTGDASTSYYHAAVMRDGRLEGLTHAPGRGFLAVWTAEREAR